MSCTELIYFNNKGEYVKDESVKNAWLGAFQIWKRLFEKYYPNGNWNEEIYINYCKNVWNLTDNFNLTDTEKICLFYTYDYAPIERKNINRLISALKEYHKEEDSLLDQAELIEKSFLDTEIEYLGTHQNSISCNFWYDNNCLKDKNGWLIFNETEINNNGEVE